MNSTVKTVLFWAGIIVSAFLLWQVVRTGSNTQKDAEINFSQFMSDVDQGIVREVTVIGVEVRGKRKSDNSAFHTTIPANYPDMYKTLRDKGVSINVKDISNGTWPTWLLNLAPLVLLAALWFFMIRQMQTKRNGLHATGQTPAPSPEDKPRFGA